MQAVIAGSRSVAASAAHPGATPSSLDPCASKCREMPKRNQISETSNGRVKNVELDASGPLSTTKNHLNPSHQKFCRKYSVDNGT